MIELLTWENLAALTALASLEIVLGIDNVVLIAILSGRLPERVQSRARKTGLLAAMVMRILLLLVITQILKLGGEVFEILGHPFSWKDLIVIVGGAFLIGKATHEIHESLEGHREETAAQKAKATFVGVIAQIMVMDAVFSMDSVITAVGMVKQDQPGALAIMITAIVLAVLVMLLAADPIARFISKHPTTKMLALSFLMLVGIVLVADGFGQHVRRGYIYSAMAFSLFVEVLNLTAKKRRMKKAGKRAMGSGQ